MWDISRDSYQDKVALKLTIFQSDQFLLFDELLHRDHDPYIGCFEWCCMNYNPVLDVEFWISVGWLTQAATFLLERICTNAECAATDIHHIGWLYWCLWDAGGRPHYNKNKISILNRPLELYHAYQLQSQNSHVHQRRGLLTWVLSWGEGKRRTRANLYDWLVEIRVALACHLSVRVRLWHI